MEIKCFILLFAVASVGQVATVASCNNTASPPTECLPFLMKAETITRLLDMRDVNPQYLLEKSSADRESWFNDNYFDKCDAYRNLLQCLQNFYGVERPWQCHDESLYGLLIPASIGVTRTQIDQAFLLLRSICNQTFSREFKRESRCMANSWATASPSLVQCAEGRPRNCQDAFQKMSAFVQILDDCRVTTQRAAIHFFVPVMQVYLVTKRNVGLCSDSELPLLVGPYVRNELPDQCTQILNGASASLVTANFHHINFILALLTPFVIIKKTTIS